MSKQSTMVNPTIIEPTILKKEDMPVNTRDIVKEIIETESIMETVDFGCNEDGSNLTIGKEFSNYLELKGIKKNTHASAYIVLELMEQLKNLNDITLKGTDKITGEEVTLKIDHLNKFYLLKQGQATNGLSKNLSKKITNDTQIDYLGNGIIEGKDFKLFIKGYTELTSGIKTSAVKLLDCFIIKLSEEGVKNNEVRLHLREYMNMRDLKDDKEARNQINEDMKALERIKFEYRERKKGKGGNWLDINLFGGTKGITNGVIHFKFNPDFVKCIPENQYMYLPKEALTFKGNKNPHRYHIIRQIALHKRLNAGRSNEDIITVETLINAIPSLPTYEEVMLHKERAVHRHIIEPFEKDMLSMTSFAWEYEGEYPKNYNDFIKSRIKITWDEYPDIQKLKTERKKHRQKTAQNKTVKKELSELQQKVSQLQGG